MLRPRRRTAHRHRRQRGAGLSEPAYLAGGELRIDAERAQRRDPGPTSRSRSGLSVEDAAHGIREVANANMARAIRSVTIERGRDPRDFTLVAFGGSGPVHAGDDGARLVSAGLLSAGLPGRVHRGRHAGRGRRAPIHTPGGGTPG